MVVQQQSLNNLSVEQLREMVASLMGHVSDKDAQIARHQTELKHIQALNAKLTHENALLKRMKFAAQSERFNASSAACSTMRWRPTWRLSAWRSSSYSPRRLHPSANNSPNASRYRPTCPGARSATSPSPPPAPVAAR